MNISQTLSDSYSPHDQARSAAETSLKLAEQQAFPQLVVSLVQELSTEDKVPENRRQAATILKNLLTSYNPVMKAQMAKRWISEVDENSRGYVKQAVVATLGSPIKYARRGAAIVIANISAIELPQGYWGDLIPQLVQLVTRQIADQQQLYQKEAALETIGYICEEIDASVLANHSASILMAVVTGMSQQETNVDIKYAAIVAMYNSLSFVSAHFQRPSERETIMNHIMGCCVFQGDEKVRVYAYECLVKVVSLYYSVALADYMGKLFELTFSTMQFDRDVCVQQAIEFWSSICDEEINMNENVAFGGPPSRNFIMVALPQLLPQILQLLMRQEEEQEEDTWDVAMAAATCLTLIAATTGNAVIQIVMSFVTQRINSTNWREREAATMAFGCILEGPDDNALANLVDNGIDVLIGRLADAPTPHVSVQDAAAWALGRLCEYQADNIPSAKYPALFNALLVAVTPNFPARVATHACWAIMNIAEAHLDHADEATSPLSPYLTHVFEQLNAVLQRDDTDEHNLQASAYEAINMCIQAAPQDCAGLVNNQLPNMIARLQATFSMPIVSRDDLDAKQELQALICGCLQTIVVKLGAAIKSPLAGQQVPVSDTIMGLVLQLFNEHNTTLLEEALMVIGAVANALEGDFSRYMSHVATGPLKVGLNSIEAYQVCSIAIGVVGDCCRALGAQMLPYAPDIIQMICAALQNVAMHHSVKPEALACFGDIALAIGGHFVSFLPTVVMFLEGAARQPVSTTSQEFIELVNKLRESIFEAYTGIIQGLKADGQQAHFMQNANFLVQYAASVYEDPTRSDDVLKAMCGVLGDLASAMGPHARELLNKPFVMDLINKCKTLKDEDGEHDSVAAETAKWAEGVIRRL